MCTVSDSQVSDLYDEAVLNEITNHVDIDNLPVLEEEIQSDEKYEIDSNSPQDMNSMQMDPGMYSPAPVNIPITEEFAGDYNFQYFFSPGKGKNCVFSPVLRKVFIDMEHRLPLRFQWDPPTDNLWLRTTLVFSEDQYRGSPVRRCLNHMATTSPSNQHVPHEILKQVVRCMHSTSIYEEFDGHLSVSVPLGAPPPGCTYVLLDFQFYCKNSCSSGMNRRATQLLFTLETKDRRVVGRRNLPVRVCSCPKRDKEKEEFESVVTPERGKKRKLPGFLTISSELPGVGKKFTVPARTINSTDYVLTIRLPDKEAAKEVTYDAYKVLSARATSGEYQIMMPYLEDIKRKLNGI